MDIKIEHPVSTTAANRQTSKRKSISIGRIPSRVRAPPLMINRLSSQQRLKREKTVVTPETELSKALESLYKEHIEVAEEEMERVLLEVEEFIHSIKYRIDKNRHNIKFEPAVIGGPIKEGTTTKSNYKHVVVYLPLKLKDIKLKQSNPGYTAIQVSRNPQYDRIASIRNEINKTLISPIKVTHAVHDIMTHVCQSTGRGEVLPFHCNPSEYGEGSHAVIINHIGSMNDITIKVIPTLYSTIAHKEDKGTILTAQPYHFDMEPDSDMLWRYDNPDRIHSTLQAMGSADRGMRCKALKLAYICHKLDPVLQLYPMEFYLVALYNMFDVDVDELPCWQTIGLEKCFVNLLSYLHQHFIADRLTHPFNRAVNILERMPETNKTLVKNRLSRLLYNRKELLRLVTSGL